MVWWKQETDKDWTPDNNTMICALITNSVSFSWNTEWLQFLFCLLMICKNIMIPFVCSHWPNNMVSAYETKFAKKCFGWNCLKCPKTRKNAPPPKKKQQKKTTKKKYKQTKNEKTKLLFWPCNAYNLSAKRPRQAKIQGNIIRHQLWPKTPMINTGGGAQLW